MATAIPNKNDILCGRGSVNDNHHGNQQFRSMVDAQRPKFRQIKKKEKRAIVLKIMQDISSLEPPGRFLVESKNFVASTSPENVSNENDSGVNPTILSKMWVIMDHEKAMKKVMHRLREKGHPDPGAKDGSQPSNEKNVQKGTSLPDANMADKLSQNEGAEGALVGRVLPQTKSRDISQSSGRVNENDIEVAEGLFEGNIQHLAPEDDLPNIVQLSSGTVHENSTTSSCMENSDKQMRGSDRRASSLSSDTPNKDATVWGDVKGGIMNTITRPSTHDGQDAGRRACSNLHDKNDLDRLLGEEPEGSKERLELQPQTTGPTFRMDAALPNATVNIMQQGTHNGPNATEGGSLDKEVGMLLDESSSQNNSAGFLYSPQCDTSITTIPISVREWMNKSITVDSRRESSRNDGSSYLLSAVDLALVLTKHLLDNLGRWVDLKLEDITSDNLSILVKPEPMALSQLANQPRPEIIGVQFHFENALPLMSVLRHADKDASENIPVDPHQACTRLGNILLEIFSKGESISTKVSHANLRNGSTNDNSTGNSRNRSNESQVTSDLLACFQDEDEDDNGSTNNISLAMEITRNQSNESEDTIDLLDGSENKCEVVAKRVAAVSLTSDSLCDKAKSLLVYVGAPLSICRLVCDLLDAARDESLSNSTRQDCCCVDSDEEDELGALIYKSSNTYTMMMKEETKTVSLDSTFAAGNLMDSSHRPQRQIDDGSNTGEGQIRYNNHDHVHVTVGGVRSMHNNATTNQSLVHDRVPLKRAKGRKRKARYRANLSEGRHEEEKSYLQALRDLTQMKDNPQMFLFDRTSPKKALDDAHLFHNADKQLFGRKREMDALMTAKNNITRHCSMGRDGILFETAFLAGYAGSGKSCLLCSLLNECEKDEWFVLKCKFDSKSVPLRVIAKAFDDFFRVWGPTSDSPSRPCDPSMLQSFHQVCQAIFSTFDDQDFGQLCAMIPNMSRIFSCGSASGNVQGLSSEGAAGAAEKRLVYLINSLLQALCSSGRPVLLALDDIQWSDSVVMTVLSSFDVIHMNGESSVRRGLMIAGTYRSNEVKEGGDVLETIDLMKNSDESNLTMLNVDGLSEREINHLISSKLGLPRRYTLGLVKLVHRKTKGNPFFVIQFLKTIISNKMLQFSVRHRRWTWDCDTIDLQMISDGVAELLTATFDRLPVQLIQTLKIISLFGNQIHVLMIDKMNSGQQVLSFDMKPELDLAVKEGLLEKAGPLYAFSHDLIHQTLYDGMSAGSRSLLHKKVGKSLLESTDDANHSMHLLAVDQINIYCKDGELSHGYLSNEERSEYARANAVAAHYAMAGSSFEKARLYVDVGIKLLQPGHWEDQYTLSLDLFEMSASLSYMCGDTTNMASCLNESILHAKTFEDSLNAAAMLSRLLTSSHEHNEAITNCLDILTKLGEDFPQEPDLTIVQNKLSEIKQLLSTLTADRMEALPTMTDTSKLQAMNFLGMLCDISLIAAPVLLPLISVRMMELTLQFGSCSDSILGIFYTAYSVFLFTDDAQLAYQVGKIGVRLREESQHKHLLRSRLLGVWEGGIKPMIEPLQAIVAQLPSIFKSAMLVGDVQNAVYCRCLHCLGSFFAGEDLTAVSNHFALCIQQSAKFQQHVPLNTATGVYRVLVKLTGKNDTVLKSFEELYQIGKESNNNLLVFSVVVSQMCVHFWFKDYTAIMKLCEKHPAPAAKRLLSKMRCLFEGVAALNLARQQPNEPKYRVIGEKAVKDMSKLEQMNKWTFEHKSLLLQAELHYLNQDYEAAEDAYIASIKSAKDHKFMNEEAMANELFGAFCIERQMCDKGMKHLRVALDLYKQWGAMNKAADLEKFIDLCENH